MLRIPETEKWGGGKQWKRRYSQANNKGEFSRTEGHNSSDWNGSTSTQHTPKQDLYQSLSSCNSGTSEIKIPKAFREKIWIEYGVNRNCQNLDTVKPWKDTEKP